MRRYPATLTRLPRVSAKPGLLHPGRHAEAQPGQMGAGPGRSAHIGGPIPRVFQQRLTEQTLHLRSGRDYPPEDTLAAMQDTLKRISGQNREAFEKHENAFQDYRNWPGVPPRPTRSEKVLDAQ